MALTWTTTVLIPKDRGEYRRIWIVEVICKVCVSVIKNRLRAVITLHDALCGLRQRRGEATETMEEKLAQNLLE